MTAGAVSSAEVAAPGCEQLKVITVTAAKTALDPVKSNSVR